MRGMTNASPKVPETTMAEAVQRILEAMVPELEDLERLEIFSKVCVCVCVCCVCLCVFVCVVCGLGV